jgi:hypothetical protein
VARPATAIEVAHWHHTGGFSVLKPIACLIQGWVRTKYYGPTSSVGSPRMLLLVVSVTGGTHSQAHCTELHWHSVITTMAKSLPQIPGGSPHLPWGCGILFSYYACCSTSLGPLHGVRTCKTFMQCLPNLQVCLMRVVSQPRYGNIDTVATSINERPLITGVWSHRLGEGCFALQSVSVDQHSSRSLDSFDIHIGPDRPGWET